LPVQPGTLTPVDIVIADQINKRFTLTVDLGSSSALSATVADEYGAPFTNFDTSLYGGQIFVAVARRNLTSLYLTSAVANATNAGGGGGGMMGGAPKPAGKTAPVTASLRPQILVPAQGQYVVFVDFWPASGNKVTVAAPLTVGTDDTLAANLTPDETLIQPAGDLNIALNSNGPLVARRPLVLSFEATDAQGTSRTDAIQAASIKSLQLAIVDEKLTTFLRPDFVNRHRMEFAVTFPKPGIYKAWLYFAYGGQLNQAAYVFEVR
jgi:hypothetical protein